MRFAIGQMTVAIRDVREAAAASEAIGTANGIVEFLDETEIQRSIDSKRRTSSSSSSAISIFSQIN